MKNIQQTISTITRQLISAFALLDGWFDKDNEFLCYASPANPMSTRDVMEHTMLYNGQLLAKIGQGSLEGTDLILSHTSGHAAHIHDLDGFALDAVDINDLFEEVIINQRQALPVIRRKLRDQLNDCLYQLELLGSSNGILYPAALTVDSVPELDVCQYIYFVARHTRSKAGLLETIEKEYLEKI